METFLGGVGVLLISGLAWLAYHHRKFYSDNVQPMAQWALAIVGGFIFGAQSVIDTYRTTLPTLLKDDAASGFLKRMEERSDYLSITLGLVIALSFYVMILLLVPRKEDR